MKIKLYHTVLCPRCLYTSSALKKILEHSPQIKLETIEVATNLTRTRQAGIKTVPAIKIGNDVLTGLLLTPHKIRSFIDQHLQRDASEHSCPGH